MSSSTDAPVWGDASKEPPITGTIALGRHGHGRDGRHDHEGRVAVVAVAACARARRSCSVRRSTARPRCASARRATGRARPRARARGRGVVRVGVRGRSRGCSTSRSCGLTGLRMPYACASRTSPRSARARAAYDAAVLVQHGDAGHAHDHLCIVWGAIVEALGEAAAARVLVVAPQFFDDALAAAAAASPDDDAGGRAPALARARRVAPKRALAAGESARVAGGRAARRRRRPGTEAPAFAVSSHDVFDELIGALAEATARGEEDGAVDSELPRAARPRRALVVVGVGRAGELLEKFAVSPRGRQHTDEAAAAARGVPPVSWLLGADNDDDGKSGGAAASHWLAHPAPWPAPTPKRPLPPHRSESSAFLGSFSGLITICALLAPADAPMAMMMDKSGLGHHRHRSSSLAEAEAEAEIQLGSATAALGGSGGRCRGMRRSAGGPSGPHWQF